MNRNRLTVRWSGGESRKHMRTCYKISPPRRPAFADLILVTPVRVAVIVLASLVLSLHAQDVAEHTSSPKKWAVDLVAPYGGLDLLRQLYLAQRSVSPDVARAIEEREVILGMCPLQAIAAAGLPVSYVVDARSDVGLLFHRSIITEQCEHPDDRIWVELLFRNASQFHTPVPVVFRVRFEQGRAVFVTKDRRLGLPPQIDEETDYDWWQRIRRTFAPAGSR